MNKKICFLLALSFIFMIKIKAQDDDISKMLDSISPEEVQYAYGTFKATRIIDGHSIERMPNGQLDFRIAHRFGQINKGAYELFGLDQSTMFIGLEYGINNWLMVGLDRTTYEKTVNSFLKFSILRQCSGAKNMPVSLSYLASMNVNGLKWANPDRKNYFSSRLTYVNQLLVARKFGEKISLQIAPTWIHKNLVPTAMDDNDIFAVGVAGRYKLTRRIAFNAEYYPVIRPVWNISAGSATNCLSLGFDIETGGHVFQLFVSNSIGMLEKTFIGETTGKWSKGDLHFGFNISRVFSFKTK
jgi:hypothetical protein